LIWKLSKLNRQKLNRKQKISETGWIIAILRTQKFNAIFVEEFLSFMLVKLRMSREANTRDIAMGEVLPVRMPRSLLNSSGGLPGGLISQIRLVES